MTTTPSAAAASAAPESLEAPVATTLVAAAPAVPPTTSAAATAASASTAVAATPSSNASKRQGSRSASKRDRSLSPKRPTTTRDRSRSPKRSTGDAAPPSTQHRAPSLIRVPKVKVLQQHYEEAMDSTLRALVKEVESAAEDGCNATRFYFYGPRPNQQELEIVRRGAANPALEEDQVNGKQQGLTIRIVKVLALSQFEADTVADELADLFESADEGFTVTRPDYEKPILDDVLISWSPD